MKIIKTNLNGLKIFEDKVNVDTRGYLKELFKKQKINKNFKFEFVSLSKKNVVRGLHFQIKKPQAKFISVLSGKIFDVVVDLRKKSKTFGKTFKIILSEKNCLSLYIPEGFAHAYFSYDKLNVVYYKLNNYYKPNFESGINLMDKKLKISWPSKNYEISKKDKKLQNFQQFCKNYKFL